MSDVRTLTALRERPDCASSRGRTAQMHRRYQIMPTELTACAQVYNVGFNNMHRLGTVCIYFQHLKKKKKVLPISLSKKGNKGQSS